MGMAASKDDTAKAETFVASNVESGVKYSKEYKAASADKKEVVLKKYDEEVAGHVKTLDAKGGMSALVIVLIVLGVILVLVAGFFFYRAYADKTSSSDDEPRATNATGVSAYDADAADMV